MLGDIFPIFLSFSSWKARLALMCSRAQQVVCPSPPSKPAERPWFYSLPHLQASSASASSQSRAPPGGAVVHFSVPETSTPSLLAVSEFSALLTFVTPGNTQTTVALWDMESGSLSYHQSEGVAVPVQHSGERQQRLLLKSKLSSDIAFQVIFKCPYGNLREKQLILTAVLLLYQPCLRKIIYLRFLMKTNRCLSTMFLLFKCNTF